MVKKKCPYKALSVFFHLSGTPMHFTIALDLPIYTHIICEGSYSSRPSWHRELSMSNWTGSCNLEDIRLSSKRFFFSFQMNTWWTLKAFWTRSPVAVIEFAVPYTHTHTPLRAAALKGTAHPIGSNAGLSVLPNDKRVSRRNRDLNHQAFGHWTTSCMGQII